ncbi:hypothetical protein [Paenibacillus farraposensis]|uniref:hypothetical protein n=1 Tax=Paenibacillus farraposensis TaxID=2807095 RepID=UPI001E3448FA|nr:hypothetical protein [Paenibacillus farraposensis]
MSAGLFSGTRNVAAVPVLRGESFGSCLVASYTPHDCAVRFKRIDGFFAVIDDLPETDHAHGFIRNIY